jgi:hypothetical protein
MDEIETRTIRKVISITTSYSHDLSRIALLLTGRGALGTDFLARRSRSVSWMRWQCVNAFETSELGQSRAKSPIQVHDFSWPPDPRFWTPATAECGAFSSASTEQHESRRRRAARPRSMGR